MFDQGPQSFEILNRMLTVSSLFFQLQIPIRSVTKVTKEKTAKIIPNAIGLTTVEHEKHIFSSLLSRDATFKLMSRLWKRALRNPGPDPPSDCILDSVGFMHQNKLLTSVCNPRTYLFSAGSKFLSYTCTNH